MYYYLYICDIMKTLTSSLVVTGSVSYEHPEVYAYALRPAGLLCASTNSGIKSIDENDISGADFV